MTHHKPLADQHVFDYRPRFCEGDHQLIQALARRADLPPAVLIRQLVRQRLAELSPGGGRCVEDAVERIRS